MYPQRMPSVISILGVVAGALCTSSVFAQENTLDEIIVTAQKRSQDVQTVGIAMQAYSGEQLEELGITESVDLAKVLSNVAVSGSWGGQMSQFTIRGVTQNDFNDHVESVVALYVDDTYVAMQQGQTFATFDLDHVEALKGPQGTLFGRNATAGLVHYITKRPTETFEGFLNASYGSYSDVRVETALSGPLSDTVSARISGLYQHTDGYIDNHYPSETFVPSAFRSGLGGNQTPGAGSDLGGVKHLGALRGQLLFKLGDSAKLLLSGVWSDSVAASAPYLGVPSVAIYNSAGAQIDVLEAPRDNLCQGIQEGACVHGPFSSTPGVLRPVAGADFFGYRNPKTNGRSTSCDFCFDDSNRWRTYGGTANFSMDFNDVTFTSITDYKNFDKFFSLDLDGGPENQMYWLGESDAHTWSEELRLNGSVGKTQWVGGAYFLSIDNRSVHGLGALPDSAYLVPDWQQPRVANLKTKSYSLFGQGEYALTDTVSLIMGLRGTLEKKDYGFEVLFVSPSCGSDLWCYSPSIDIPGFSQSLYSADSSDKLWNWKTQINWQASEQMMLYAGVTQGMKAGSFNAGGPPLPAADIPYKPEKLISYETGLKSTFWDDRARLNAAVFYYDYHDYQEARWLGFSSLITNQDAEFYGAEIDFNALVTQDLEFMLNVGLQKNKVKKLDVAGVPTDVEAAYAPRETISALLKYTLPSDVFSSGKLSFQVDGNYHSAVWDNPNKFTANRLPGYALANARVTWVDSSGRLKLDGGVENLTNKTYRTIGFDLSQVCGCNLVAYGKPRWATLSASYQF